MQVLIVLVFAGLVAVVWQWVYHGDAPSAALASSAGPPAPAAALPADPAELERCKVPDFAKALGHEAMWKLHNNCQ